MRRAALLGACALVCAAPAAAHASAGSAVRHEIAAYFDALARRHAPAACSHLTPRSRERLAEFGKAQLGIAHPSCAGTLRALFRSPGGGPSGGRRRHRVLTVSFRGRTATARVRNVEGPMRLEREHGRWLIDSEPTGEKD
jgi:hypothetical protein